MASVEGTNRLCRQLTAKARAVGEPDVRVEVGYASPHAVPVHENRQMRWKGKPRRSGIGKYWDAQGGPGRAGYLLDVAREMYAEIRASIRSSLQRGRTLAQAAMTAGRLLQRRSMTQVPYEHGDLKASAFTRQKGGGG